MPPVLDITYPALQALLEPHLGPGRTDSQAFLLWFLEHFYRLDPDSAKDCVCDGGDDKGVDGLFVDDNLETIDVFQTKLFLKPAKTVGDTLLKEFSGSLAQFSTPKTIAQVAKNTTNRELRNLLQSEEVARKVEAGYAVRGIFLSNAPIDGNASSFLATQTNLHVYDRTKLVDLYVPLGPSGPVDQQTTFNTQTGGCAEYNVDGIKSILASVRASELVQLGGIPSGALFAWNVRQSLGRTKVNREIGISIEDSGEHKHFMLYHNGLTILAREVSRSGNAVTLNHYAVVNGCQSLSTLYEHRAKLTDQLRVIVRIIQVSPESELANKITHHSNNQNAISARDLQSNSALQRRIQQEFAKHFPKDYSYRIKRGEEFSTAQIIENPDAARVLLAFDLKQPWACHQTGKLFDDLHTQIFGRPEVTAHRVLALHQAYLAVDETIPTLSDELMRGYNLTRFFLLYLLRVALESDDMGKKFCADPTEFVTAKFGPIRIKQTLSAVLRDLIVDLNAELKDRIESGNPIDYKRELKSQASVRQLERNIIPNFIKAVGRDRATSFGAEWQSSAPKEAGTA